MHISNALEHLTKNPDLTGFFVVALQGYGQPTTFITTFFHRLKELSSEMTFLDGAQSSLNDCKAQLEMSFLGSRRVYILKNLSSLDAASKKIWNTYLKNYQGPHTLIFFETLGKPTRGRTPTKVPKNRWIDSDTTLAIELPEQVDAFLYKDLFTFLYPSVAYNPSFVRALFTHNRLSLDDASRMMAYQTVVGRNSSTFFSQWYPKLVISDTSLFTLSQLFLGRTPKQFFQHWNRCKDDFPPEFWVAYWSEQIWQAAQFVTKARTFGLAEAKKGFYRLPFKFLSTDWQKYTPATLVKAHNELYEFDYALKNGGGQYGLELWFHRFLSTT